MVRVAPVDDSHLWMAIQTEATRTQGLSKLEIVARHDSDDGASERRHGDRGSGFS